MDFKRYLTEAATAAEQPVTGDSFDISVNETLNIESNVVDHQPGSVTITLDERAMGMLEQLGCEFSEELDEGVKDWMKIMALVGLTGYGASAAMDQFSPKNSPLGQALASAAAEGDRDAAEYLRNLGAYIDGNDTGTLRMLNFRYLEEPAANESVVGEAGSYSDRGAQNMMKASRKADKEADKVRAQRDKDEAKKKKENVKESYKMTETTEEVDDFLRELNADDVGVSDVGAYRVHYEGFSDWCQQDAEERCSLPTNDPRHLNSYDDIYDEVLRDFIAREDGKQPIESGLTGDEDYPVFYAVFDRETVDEARMSRKWELDLVQDMGNGYWISAEDHSDDDVRKTAYSVYHLEDPSGLEDQQAFVWRDVGFLRVSPYRVSRDELIAAAKEVIAKDQSSAQTESVVESSDVANHDIHGTVYGKDGRSKLFMTLGEATNVADDMIAKYKVKTGISVVQGPVTGYLVKMPSPTLGETKMPASVVKDKERIRHLTDKEFAAKYGDRSEKELRDMAGRHGYGWDKTTKTGSDHYVRRALRGKKEESVTEGVSYSNVEYAAGQLMNNLANKQNPPFVDDYMMGQIEDVYAYIAKTPDPAEKTNVLSGVTKNDILASLSAISRLNDEDKANRAVAKKIMNIFQRTDEYIRKVLHRDNVREAEYQGREVKLGKPTTGDVKKFKVYVKDPKTGNVKKVNFGDPNMEIKRDNPERRKNFRARHNCADKTDRTKAGYWSCRMWSNKPVSKII